MSAIPNLPEHVLNAADPNTDAAVKHRIRSQESAVHIEDIKQHVNGVTNSHDQKAKTQWTIHDTPIENQRPIKVIVIGAGFSGIYCGIRIPERIRNCELVIYEKNAGVGGEYAEI